MVCLHSPKHFRQLGVRQRQSPQTKVGSSVGDTTQAEFDGMNDLMDSNVAKVETFLLLFARIARISMDTEQNPCNEPLPRPSRDHYRCHSPPRPHLWTHLRT